jgi:predicted translin family RNA/ssDNA-binding protein
VIFFGLPPRINLTDVFENIHKPKKSLKIPEWISEAVIRRTDNTMAKIKRTNNDVQNTTQKTKDRAT